MKKLLQKLTFKHFKWKDDASIRKIMKNDYIVLFADGKWEFQEKYEVIRSLKNQNNREIKYIVERADLMHIEEEIEVVEGDNENTIIKTDES